MSEEDHVAPNVTTSAAQAGETRTEGAEALKGKGKAPVATDDSMMDDDEDESSDEEPGAQEEPEEADDDNMEEIDTDNIISDGRRTRGKNIDFAKAAEGLDDEDEDEDEDDDFEDPDEMKD